MGRKISVPGSLMRGAVTLDDARRLGLDRWHFEGVDWRRVGPGTYLHANVPASPRVLIEAAHRRLPREAAFSGLTAAWLHGLKVTPDEPIDVTVPAGTAVSSRAGMKLRRRELEKGDVVAIAGMRATSMVRTLRDICIHTPLVDSVVLVDMALHAGLVSLGALREAVDAGAGKHGVQTLRRVIDFAEPKSESQMETRLRMVLVLGGLPRPEAQVSIRNRFFQLLGRLDLYYRDQRLGIEYDGATHEDSLAQDNRRQNLLVEAGIRLLRFTAGDVFTTPELVVSQVRAALAK